MVEIIKGGEFSDERGQLKFFNNFNMDLIKRFYLIKNKDTDLIRGWRGHKIESRWFYLITGKFQLSYVKIDDWTNPSKDLIVETIILEVKSHQLIYIPAGYATALRAILPDSEIMVFADYDLEHAVKDNYLFDSNYFKM